MTNDDELLRLIDVQVKQLLEVRAVFPHMNKNLVGARQFNTAPLYRNRGHDITFAFSRPLTEEDIDRYHAIGHWINQSFVLRLWALLEGHRVVGSSGSEREINQSLPGHDEVDILRRLRNEFAHTSGKYDPQKPEQKKLHDRIFEHFELRPNDHPSDHPGFPIPIDAVLMKLAEGCKEYVRALAATQ